MQIFIAVIINRAFIPDLHRKKERKEREPSVTIRLPIILLSWKIIPSYRFDKRGEESSKASEDAFHVARPTKNSFTWANVG